MKHLNTLILTLVLVFPIGLFAQMNQPIPIIKATKDLIDIRDGDTFQKGSWRLSPEYKPDVYTTYLKKRRKKVTFYTDLDSISFDVKLNKTYDFVILLNGKDSCFTRIETKKNIPVVNFTKKYKSNNQGKFSFEVPEVQELVHIIMAITPTGISDSNMVNHEGAYYEKVMQHFSKYKNENIVKRIDEIIKRNYAHLKMDACGFYFKKNKLKKSKTYDRLNWSRNNYMNLLIKELETFAIKTEFRKFYKENKSYYNELKVLMEKQSPIKKQWNWVEKNFPNKYDNYRITFSPLVNGNHSTNKFETSNFKQTVMFVCGPLRKKEMSSDYSDKVKEGLMTRVIFTEIDHNYVNPVSDLYIDKINESFNDRKKWTIEDSSAKYYPNAYSVFNEYMTFAVFSLYALDNFDEENFNIINDLVETMMVKRRGFSKFKEFNQKMIELYKNRPKNTKAVELYPSFWIGVKHNKIIGFECF